MPDERYTHLVTNPRAELDTERAKHRVTLNKIKAIWERAQVLDGRSAISHVICKLCQDIPMGKNLSWRPSCPLHTALAYVEEELARLDVPIRHQFGNLRNAPQDAATPSTE